MMDFRIKRTVEAGRFATELEGLASGLGLFGALKVTSLELLQQAQLQQAKAPAARAADVAEAEKSRAQGITTPADVFNTVASTFKFARGALVAVIIGALLWVGFPFLKAAGKVAAKAATKKGG